MIWRYKLAGSYSGRATSRLRSRPCSQLFPVGKRHQLVQDFLQPLQATFVIPRCARHLLFFSAMQVQSVRFTELRYFVSQLGDPFFDGTLHDNRLAEQSRSGDSCSEPSNKGQQNSWPKVDWVTLIVHFCMLSFFILSAAILSDMT
jgi:hypothetical protein